MSNKKQRDIELFIVDVFVAIYKIKIYTKTFKGAEELRYSNLHWDATIRELELIGEALNHLLNDEQFSLLLPAYFRKIVNFRNVIVHAYFGIDETEVWNIISEKLNFLENDLFEVCKGRNDFAQAIESQIIDYQKLKDKETVEYLKKLCI